MLSERAPTPRLIRIYQGALVLALALATVIAVMLTRVLEEEERLAAPLPALRISTAPRPRPPAPPPDIAVIDVGARLREWARLAPQALDHSDGYYTSKQATMHMHIMGLEQTCPLHIHRASEEATLIVGGDVEVTQVYDQKGRLATHKAEYHDGDLIYSPPFCGHQFRNLKTDAMLGNLVISAPPFEENFYIQPNDPRLHKGGPPFHFHPADELKALLASGAPAREVPLPIMGGRLSALLVAGRFTLPGNPNPPTLAYVASGAGTVGSATGKALPVSPTDLVRIQAATEVIVTAAPGKPLAIYLFRPEQPVAR